MAHTVLITLPEADLYLLTGVLMSVADERDPIIDWRDPDELDESDDVDAIPVTVPYATYADHPLLPVAQAVLWYAAGDCLVIDTPDGPVLRVRSNANHELLTDALTQSGVAFTSD